MKVIRASALRGTGRESTFSAGARALSYLTAEDGCGFALATVGSDGDLESGPLHYPHQVKATYVLRGSGELMSEDGQPWALEPMSFYVVGPGDRYRLRLAGPWLTVSFFCRPPRGHCPRAGGRSGAC